MKNLLKQFIAIAFVTIISVSAFAYDFEVDGIYYSINGEGTVAVTYNNRAHDYTGNIVIPAEVTYEGITYTVTAIGTSAFENSYSSLSSVTMPNTITTIGNSAFAGCIGIWQIDIPASVTRIEDNAFYGCTGIQSIEIPHGVTEIGGYTFYNCVNLRNITLCNGITSIGECAFTYCRIEQIAIPSTVTRISNWAFSRCYWLDTVICEGETPASLGNYVFINTHIDTATLIVPCNAAANYQNAAQWNDFGEILEDCEGIYVGIEGVKVENDNSIFVYPNPAKENITLEVQDDIFIYNDKGQEVLYVNSPNGKTTINVANLPKGIYFIKAGERRQKFIKE